VFNSLLTPFFSLLGLGSMEFILQTQPDKDTEEWDDDEADWDEDNFEEFEDDE